MYQHFLALLHANRFASPHRFVVDGKHLVAHFEAGGAWIEGLGPLGMRSGICFFIVIFLFGIEKWLPFAERDENFLIVISWVVRRLDHEEAELARVSPAVQ